MKMNKKQFQNKLTKLQLMKLASAKKKADIREMKEENLKMYTEWFRNGLRSSIDPTTITSTDIINWASLYGMYKREAINKIQKMITLFDYERVPNPDTKDGRYWKHSESYMLYRKIATQPTTIASDPIEPVEPKKIVSLKPTGEKPVIRPSWKYPNG